MSYMLNAECSSCGDDLVCPSCDKEDAINAVTWKKLLTVVESLSDVDVKRRLLQSLHELHKWDKESLVGGLNALV